MRYKSGDLLKSVLILTTVLLAGTSAFAQVNRVVAEAEGIT